MHDGDEEQRDERQHFDKVLAAFDAYRERTLARIGDMERHAARLAPCHRELLHLEAKFDALRRAAEQNGLVIDSIVEPHHSLFNPRDPDEGGLRPDHTHRYRDARASISESDMDKVKSTLKQFVRDWSAEGAAERAACYGPLLADIARLLPADAAARRATRVLVPGAGLGRLAWECARLGFGTQGNECSYFMLLAANHVLNRDPRLGQAELHPFIHQSINVRSPADQLRAVAVPDVAPSALPEDVPFSMCAGDFVTAYAQQVGEWDCIVTCFFIDTARDISEYVRTIYAALKPGGLWLNLGPLLYHYAEMGAAEFSVELSWEELRAMIAMEGFEIELEEWLLDVTYASNIRSMLRMVYDCVHTVCRKPRVTA
jgi:carnosine N-methyltransferase